MTQKVRVRFAPSPTGPLHIGGVRTALFNYLFAKKHGGDFVLRIEDTDQNRYVVGAEQYIVDAMNWLGIPFDESPSNPAGFEPYRQSERKDLYKKYADQLIENKHAYYAFDSADALDTHRKKDEENGKTFIYNWHNRLILDNSLSLSKEELQKKMGAGENYVIRFKSPQDETLMMKDIIRGSIKIDTNVLDDKVLFKSDGMPTYHLANIVDDHLMEITHVIRGEEWLPSMALHVLLYRSLGWDAPKFAHLPLILKPDGKGKLSKRDGDAAGFPVFPLEWIPEKGGKFMGYREEGYIPAAVINMLAFLGWNPGTEQELFSLEDLIEAFSLENVNKSGARFDPKKSIWFQNQYLQKQENGVLALEFEDYLREHQPYIIKKAKDVNALNLITIVGLIKERANFVSDLWEQGSFFFETPASYDEKASKKAFKEDTARYLTSVATILEGETVFTAASVSAIIKGWITDNEISFGKIMMPMRLALVGAMKGPDVFDIVSVLGKEEALLRIKNAINHLS
jgi:glutamyl-tRNA synthetase